MTHSKTRILYHSFSITNKIDKWILQVEQWKRQMASKEYAYYINHYNIGSADSYKEDLGRLGGYYGKGKSLLWGENRMKKLGHSDSISQKKATIRKKYDMESYQDLNPHRFSTTIIQLIPYG